ncbi:methyltransferase [Romboutsia sp. 1001713B170207_170306_H8]|uniref:methyltransferase n=2 Tax=unclassified Romboutsia TaxID=2626894 RepID=UPI000822899F|nr:methyltransferase [Romboutsia sp. 1001713B170207_170306_H8]SCH62195.1 Uncharacterised protein [uncultured Clostridium sp.]
MKDIDYENLFNINTFGEEHWTDKFTHYHPYQATSYSALNTLFKTYKVNENDYVVDFGCGKGRLIFYINYFFKANCYGVEMNKDFYRACIKNKSNYLNKNKKYEDKIEFVNAFAQNYSIGLNDNKFYFFNPFSIQIFIKVIDNILDSLEKNMRPVEIILYYPSDDYIYYLENNTPFIIKNEIILDDLYKKDNNERFLIYKLSYLE